MRAQSFTVVIPAYNRAAVVGRAVASVLGQRGASFTVVVVDDGSTDDTAAVVEGMDDARVRLCRVDHGGVSAARNVGVACDDGEWVTFLDSDDEAEAGWLAAFDGALRDGADVASVAVRLVYADGAVEVQRPVDHGPAFAQLPITLLAGGFALRRSVFEATGGFAAGLEYSENTDLGLRLARVREAQGLRCDALDRELVTVHARRDRYEPARRYASATALLAADGDRFRLDPRLHALYLGVAGVAAGRVGRRREAVVLLGRAVRLGPWSLRSWARSARAAVSPKRA